MAAGAKNPYIVVGYGGSINNFSGTLFPVMSPSGNATYMQNCAMCHVNSTEQNDLPLMGNLNQVTDPQGWINPVGPISSACSGCHVSKDEASHFLANTDVLGESCSVCHSAGAQFADKGTSWLIWFLAMISANLAVVNFLPIPIVDGGLFTFLILEKIQGRPLSPQTQKIVQVVGLALILGVFLLVTYQDFARMAGF